MYRRRRGHRDKIAFSFDSFLDVVANVNGIIIRLILMAWVGARAYHGAMQVFDESTPEIAVAELAPPRVEDEPLTPILARQQEQLAAARKSLAEKLAADEAARRKLDAVAGQLTSLTKSREQLGNLSQRLAADVSKEQGAAKAAALSVEELQRRGQHLHEAIAKLEKSSGPRAVLRYHTPVSKAVTTDEIFFECRGGRVTYLDLPGFLNEIESSFPAMKERLREQFSLDEVTRSIGSFRVRYTVERQRSAGESLGGLSAPQNRLYFGYRLGRFVVEPIAAERGENQAQSLRPTSEFRQSVDALDAQTVVTFWVYPDSFALFRTLRDYLYERGIEVAARPLPMDEPISGSPTGTKSRGQ